MADYLYEIMEDYKYAATGQEKESIFQSFCSLIWDSGNKRRVCTKAIRFTVRKNLLSTDVGQIFAKWSEIKYTGYQSTTKETDWCNLIRQKINNLYTVYFDKEVICNKDYLRLLQTPRTLYRKFCTDAVLMPDEVSSAIESALVSAEALKTTCQMQKMDLSWQEYQKVIESILLKIFDKCKLIEEFEDASAPGRIYDFMNEDNFYIRYFCRYLTCEMKQWQKKYYGVKNHRPYIRCRRCGGLAEKTNNRILYCKACRVIVNREKTKENKNRTHV